MTRKLENLRNIGIIAHIDAGKTTVTERMLYYSGAKHRVGEVDKGTTETDSDPEEQERGITIYSACVTFDWNQVHINLLDTPGHVDFTAEVERCLRVLDGAVVVFSAREGVEAQSETVWRQADKYHVPRIAFINKMDREGANFELVLEEIDKRLGGQSAMDGTTARPVAIQIPVGQGPSHFDDPFRGVIDLVSFKFLTFEFSDGKRDDGVTAQEIPAELLEEATMWRQAMLDKLYDFSDELVLTALQEQPIPEDLIRQVLRSATLAHQIHPVLCGSALHGIGVQPVLDAVAEYLPSPADMPPVEGESLKKAGALERRQAKPDEPFCGLVFKILPAKTGDLSWVRVYSGCLKTNTRALNAGKDKRENIAQLWHIHATKKAQQIDQVEAGDIAGIVGLRATITGDTLCDTKRPLLLETIEFPETVISVAIEPETALERKKLSETLDLLKRQDPTLQIRGSDSGQTLISGMGELHLEVIKNKLLRDFNLDVKFHNPQVSYRETIAQTVEVEAECQRQIAGQQLFAKLKLRMELREDDGPPVVILNRCPPETLPDSLLQAALDELRARAEGGGLIAGFPLMKLRVSVLGGEAQEGLSDERAFRIVANEGFNQCLEAGGKVLLEPIMKLDILTPEEYVGDFVGDLQQRRAVIANTESRGIMTSIVARAPLRELVGYSSAMRSLSQGRAGHSMEPLEYAPAPPEVLKEYAI
jgi:elongation factor G